MPKKVEKSDSEWRAQLTDEQYRVTRLAGTERAFTGEYYQTKTPGTYKCVCCGEPLFTSGSKFDSGCGWPSFTRPATPDVVEESTDESHGMIRTEVTCQSCGAHLGHVFPDGPPADGGLRYCINSASLELEPEE